MKAKLIAQPRQERVILGDNLPLKTPFVVYIEPSGYCNLKCVFCPQTSGDEAFIREMMPFNLWKEAIDDLAEFPGKVKLLRVCGNGEPLTNKNLAKMLKYAKGKVERIELITNGTLLNPYFIRELPKWVDRIIISIEGLSNEGYQRISGVAVDFQELVDNLGKLYWHKGNCTIHIKIHHEAVPTATGREVFFDIFGDICDEIYIENLIQMWPEFDSQHAIKKFRYGNKFVKKEVCVQMFKGFQIQAGGEVVPCCVDWKRVNVIGDIRKQSVKEVWEGRNLRLLRTGHLIGDKNRIEPCRDCTMNDYNEIDNIDADADKILTRL